MPQFPEKESSLLAKLRKAQPCIEEPENSEKKSHPSAVMATPIDKIKSVGTANSSTTNALFELDSIVANGDTNQDLSKLSDIFENLGVGTTNGVKPTENSLLDDGLAICNKNDYIKLVIH